MAAPQRKAAQGFLNTPGKLAGFALGMFVVSISAGGLALLQAAWQVADLDCTRATDGAGTCEVRRRDGLLTSDARFPVRDLRGAGTEVIMSGKNRNVPLTVLVLDTAGGPVRLTPQGVAAGPASQVLEGHARDVAAFAKGQGAGTLTIHHEDPEKRTLFGWIFAALVLVDALTCGLFWMQGTKALRRSQGASPAAPV